MIRDDRQNIPKYLKPVTSKISTAILILIGAYASSVLIHTRYTPNHDYCLLMIIAHAGTTYLCQLWKTHTNIIHVYTTIVASLKTIAGLYAT